jgi:hypothetical protein
MMNNSWLGYSGAFVPGFLTGWLTILVIPIALWSLFWMGVALWKAARNDSKVWFIVLLLVHTMGILDILYVFIFSKKKVTKSRK